MSRPPGVAVRSACAAVSDRLGPGFQSPALRFAYRPPFPEIAQLVGSVGLSPSLIAFRSCLVTEDVVPPAAQNAIGDIMLN